MHELLIVHYSGHLRSGKLSARLRRGDDTITISVVQQNRFGLALTLIVSYD